MWHFYQSSQDTAIRHSASNLHITSYRQETRDYKLELQCKSCSTLRNIYCDLSKTDENVIKLDILLEQFVLFISRRGRDTTKCFK